MFTQYKLFLNLRTYCTIFKDRANRYMQNKEEDKEFPFIGEREPYLRVIMLAFTRRRKKTEMNITDEGSGTRTKGKCFE